MAISGSGSSARAHRDERADEARAAVGCAVQCAASSSALLAASCARAAPRVAAAQLRRRSAPRRTPGAPPSASTHKPGVVGDRRVRRSPAPRGAPWPARSRRRSSAARRLRRCQARPATPVRGRSGANSACSSPSFRRCRRQHQPHGRRQSAVFCARRSVRGCPCRPAASARSSRRARTPRPRPCPATRRSRRRRSSRRSCRCRRPSPRCTRGRAAAYPCTMPTDTAATKSRIGDASSRPRSRSQLTASCAATKAPVIAAVRVPPSAWSTSQSSEIVRSPRAVRSNTQRSERPIRRWISCVRPLCLPAPPRGRCACGSRAAACRTRR